MIGFFVNSLAMRIRECGKGDELSEVAGGDEDGWRWRRTDIRTYRLNGWCRKLSPERKSETAPLYFRFSFCRLQNAPWESTNE